MTKNEISKKDEVKGLPQGVRGGLICIIVGASLTLFFMLIYSIILIAGASFISKLAGPTGSSAIKTGTIIAGGILLAVCVLPILTIIFTSSVIKGKSQSYILVAIFGILFGTIVGLIGGILVLVNYRNERVEK